MLLRFSYTFLLLTIVTFQINTAYSQETDSFGENSEAKRWWTEYSRQQRRQRRTRTEQFLTSRDVVEFFSSKDKNHSCRYETCESIRDWQARLVARHILYTVGFVADPIDLVCKSVVWLKEETTAAQFGYEDNLNLGQGFEKIFSMPLPPKEGIKCVIEVNSKKKMQGNIIYFLTMMLLKK